MKKGIKIIMIMVVLSIGLLTTTACQKEKKKEETEIIKEQSVDDKIIGSWEKSTSNGFARFGFNKNKKGTYIKVEGQNTEGGLFNYDIESGIINITFEDKRLVQYSYYFRDDNLVIVSNLGEETYHRIA